MPMFSEFEPTLIEICFPLPPNIIKELDAGSITLCLQDITVCKLCVLDFDFHPLFILCWFHFTMSVSHVTCLVSDLLVILSLLVLFQGCRGRFCTGDKIQIWRNWGKWCVRVWSTYEYYMTKYTLLGKNKAFIGNVFVLLGIGRTVIVKITSPQL